VPERTLELKALVLSWFSICKGESQRGSVGYSPSLCGIFNMKGPAMNGFLPRISLLEFMSPSSILDKEFLLNPGAKDRKENRYGI
jgi:hypothetical protein